MRNRFPDRTSWWLSSLAMHVSLTLDVDEFDREADGYVYSRAVASPDAVNPLLADVSVAGHHHSVTMPFKGGLYRLPLLSINDQPVFVRIPDVSTSPLPQRDHFSGTSADAE